MKPAVQYHYRQLVISFLILPTVYCPGACVSQTNWDLPSPIDTRWCNPFLSGHSDFLTGISAIYYPAPARLCLIARSFLSVVFGTFNQFATLLTATRKRHTNGAAAITRALRLIIALSILIAVCGALTLFNTVINNVVLVFHRWIFKVQN